MEASAVTVTLEPGHPGLRYVADLDAPRERVFEAHTDPTLYARWSVPDGYRLEVDRMDVRTGGSYRWTHAGPAGERVTCHGVYHAVVAPARITNTCQQEQPDGEGLLIIEGLRLDPLPGGGTRYSGWVAFTGDGVPEAQVEEVAGEVRRSVTRLAALWAEASTDGPDAAGWPPGEAGEHQGPHRP
jgi:uncharacterized protein YndB with AHSA1/START domain